MYKLIDGKKIAAEVIAEVSAQIINGQLQPQLAVVLVGDNPASKIYIKLKKETCRQAGIEFHKYLISADADEKEIMTCVRFLNQDTTIDAILIQLPLPKKFNQQKILDAMDFRKDVDGFHSQNIASYLSGKKQHILPGLSLAIWNLIASTREKNYKGKKTLIIGKSDHFTKPTKKLLADQGMVVDIALPSDAEINEKCQATDIIVTAVGQANFITEDMVKPGAIIIDVGINNLNGQTVGDVDFKHVAPKCSYITPVPGGVGPMTVAMLLYNAVILAREKKE